MGIDGLCNGDNRKHQAMRIGDIEIMVDQCTDVRCTEPEPGEKRLCHHYDCKHGCNLCYFSERLQKEREKKPIKYHLK